MADTKISALPAATTPLAGTEVLPIVQGGITEQVSVANLTAGRSFSGVTATLTNVVATNSGVIGAAAAVSGFSSCKFTAVSAGGSYFQTTGPAAEGNYMHQTATTGDNVFVYFGTEASFATRGSISYNRGAGLVAYNVTSDYRAKDIIGPIENSGATIDALKIYEGKMKGATQSRPMFIAHEAQEIAPYCVTGVKDALNDDGTPKYQQMDVSSLVPLLIAEIQSLRTRVAALEPKS
jgi:hypothetical protein